MGAGSSSSGLTAKRVGCGSSPMMGGHGSGPMMGQMMNRNGPGGMMSGYGSGTMMGSWSQGAPRGQTISMDQAVRNVQRYVDRFGNSHLVIDELIAFQRNFYAIVFIRVREVNGHSTY